MLIFFFLIVTTSGGGDQNPISPHKEDQAMPLID